MLQVMGEKKKHGRKRKRNKNTGQNSQEMLISIENKQVCRAGGGNASGCPKCLFAAILRLSRKQIRSSYNIYVTYLLQYSPFSP